MALKNLFKSLVPQREPSQEQKGEITAPCMPSDMFPVYRASETDISKYRKIPLTEIAALGTAFSSLTASARTITQTVSHSLSIPGPLFVGMWPNGVSGAMVDKGLGFSGNIIGDQGRIAGRMRFQLLENGLPATQTTTTIMPIDPTAMIVAAAISIITQKLDALQAKSEEILQFLKLEKQSRQRGNLNMLSDIMEEYKQQADNDNLRSLRVVSVQEIKRESYHDIVFYQDQISNKLQEQKGIHGIQRAQKLMDAVMSEFYEYQLACYIHAFSGFLELMLLKNFNSAATVADNMTKLANRYHELYTACHVRISNYRNTAIETQLMGSLGNAAKAVGQKLASVPLLSKGTVDEALIHAGEALDKHSNVILGKGMKQFESLTDPGMLPFIENIQKVDMIYKRSDALLIDGESLYIIDAV